MSETQVNGIVIETDVDAEKDAASSSMMMKKEQPVVATTSVNRYNVCNIMAYGLNVFVTFGIGTFGLAGRPTNGDISDRYQTLVTPFGTSFSIWGVIFIWQAVWTVWQIASPSQRNSEGVLRAWYYYPIMTILQAGWTVSFSYEIMWLSLLFMYGILVTLILATMSLQRWRDKRMGGYLLWQAPFSIQTGWIMAASAVNTNVLPVYYDASPAVQIAIGSICLVALVVTALSWLASYPVDFAIPLVIVWALGGVYAELSNPKPSITAAFTEKQIDGTQSGVLAALCLIGIAIIAKTLYVFLKQRPEAMRKEEQEEQSEGTGKDLAHINQIENDERDVEENIDDL